MGNAKIELQATHKHKSLLRINIVSKYVERSLNNPEGWAESLVGERIRVPNARILDDMSSYDDILQVYKPVLGVYDKDQDQIPYQDFDDDEE